MIWRGKGGSVQENACNNCNKDKPKELADGDADAGGGDHKFSVGSIYVWPGCLYIGFHWDDYGGHAYHFTGKKVEYDSTRGPAPHAGCAKA